MSGTSFQQNRDVAYSTGYHFLQHAPEHLLKNGRVRKSWYKLCLDVHLKNVQKNHFFPRKTQNASATTKGLTLFMEIIAAYSENHTGHK
jgi:hypothetical protein